MKPLIGITGSMGQTVYDISMPQSFIQRHMLNDSYVQAVIQADGIPIFLPSCEDPELMKAMADKIDGLLLSGGDDLDPNLYGKRPTGKLGAVCHRRDSAELAIADYFLKKTSKPVLGICRGIQVINVALGGTLYIDLPSDGKLDHSLTMYPRNLTSHEVDVAEYTRLAAIFGAGIHKVNSFHHQAADALGEDLVITARSVPDGVIEAVELPGERFVLGVQWHPEELQAMEDAQKLFRAFVEAAK